MTGAPRNLGLKPPKPEKKPKSKRAKIFSRVLFGLSFISPILTVNAAATGTLGDMVTNLFGEGTQTVDIIILLTVLTLLPSIIIMFTGFTRIIITLSFVRNAMGTQQAPPNQVLVGLALFLTFFVMSPVISEIYNDAYVPYSEERISQEEFLTRTAKPLREFMMRQVEDSDLGFFVNLSGQEFESLDDIPMSIVMPSFITSEVKAAFRLGFFLYIPFIVIDMVVASTLMAMGMMMLPPAMISLPFKVLLFVMVDGWQLVIGSLMSGFR